MTASPTAAAQDAATAEALFLQGRQAADAGDYPLACARFEESNRLDAAPGTLLNLADCEEHLGHLAKAWQQFRQLDDQLPASDPRRPIAVARARALEPRIPKLRIVLVSPVPATAARDGVVLGLASLGVHLPVDPGRHVVVVSAAGRVDRLYELQLSEGQDAEVTVMPGDMSAPPPGPADAGASSSSATQPPTQQADAARTLDRSAPRGADPNGTGAFVVGGLGAASLATGVAFGIAALTLLNSSNASCSNGVCSNQEAINQFHSAQSLALASDATVGVGIACIGTAIVMYLIHSNGPASGSSWMSPSSVRVQF